MGYAQSEERLRFRNFEMERLIMKPNPAQQASDAFPVTEMRQVAADLDDLAKDGWLCASVAADFIRHVITPVEPAARELTAAQGAIRCYVATSKESCDADPKYWVTIERDGKTITPYHTFIRGRAEYEVAEWNHLLNGAPAPDILAYDTEALTLSQPIEPQGAVVGDFSAIRALPARWRMYAERMRAMGLCSEAEINEAKADELEAALPVAVGAGECEWVEDGDNPTWETSCGRTWIFDNGGPIENDIKHCMGCGKKVTISDAMTPATPAGKAGESDVAKEG
jgi:hypothetical protein